MKLVAQVKLLPTPEQAKLLRQTLEQANGAADTVSKIAFDERIFKRFDLHYRCYQKLRAETRLTAQVVALLFAKVADAYKLDKDTLRTFRPHGAIAFDDRILRYKPEAKQVSIWTVGGRQTIPFVCGEHQTKLLQGQRGESALCLVDGEFYLMAVCDIEDPPLHRVDECKGVIGVDLGIVQIATDSEGGFHSGETVRAVRRRLRRLRAGLQSCGSQSAKRHLKRLRRRQARFTRWVNHNISRRLVETAVALGKALALEDLTGIRERGNGFGREMRFELGNWSFFQFRTMIEYKARRAGIPVVFVDPRNTSRACSSCGYCDKHNRRSRSLFKCLECGLECDADANAARNIALKARGVVTRPMDGAEASPFVTVKAPVL